MGGGAKVDKLHSQKWFLFHNLLDFNVKAPWDKRNSEALAKAPAVRLNQYQTIEVISVEKQSLLCGLWNCLAQMILSYRAWLQ